MKPSIDLLRINPVFRRLTWAFFTSQVGDWINFLAILALVRIAGGGLGGATTVLVLHQLPFLLLSPVAGRIVDQFDRRHILIVVDSVRCLAVLGFTIAGPSSPLWLIYILAGIQYSMLAFYWPALEAIRPLVVKKADLPVANMLIEQIYSTTMAAGTVIGAALLAAGGVRLAMAVNAIVLAVSVILLRSTMIDGLSVRRRETGKVQVRRKSLLKILRKNPRIAAGIWCLSGGTFLRGSILVLVSFLGQDVFVLGEQGTISVAFLNIALVVSAIVGPYLMTLFLVKNNKLPIRIITIAFASRAIPFACLGLLVVSGVDRWLGIFLAVLCILGAQTGGPMAYIAGQAIIQRSASNEYHGRLFSAGWAALMGMGAAASYLTSAMLESDFLSASGTMFVLAFVSMATAAIWKAFRLTPRPTKNKSDIGSQTDTSKS